VKFRDRPLVPQAPLLTMLDGAPVTQPRRNLTVREAFEQAFMGSGGVPALIEWAKENRTAFYQLYARLLPLEVTGEDGGPLKIQLVRFCERDLIEGSSHAVDLGEREAGPGRPGDYQDR